MFTCTKRKNKEESKRQGVVHFFVIPMDVSHKLKNKDRMKDSAKDKSFLFNMLDGNLILLTLLFKAYLFFCFHFLFLLHTLTSLRKCHFIFCHFMRNLTFTFAASMALATVMNCWGETDLRIQRLRNVWSEPDLRFDISTPLSRVRIFHPSLSFPLFVSEAANNSCIQLSLANCTYLLRESSLIDL